MAVCRDAARALRDYAQQLRQAQRVFAEAQARARAARAELAAADPGPAGHPVRQAAQTEIDRAEADMAQAQAQAQAANRAAAAQIDRLAGQLDDTGHRATGGSTQPVCTATTPPPTPDSGDDGWFDWSTFGHLALDATGLVPIVGTVADAANAAWYAAEGNYVMASTSAAAMIPIAGQIATGAKYTAKTTKTIAKHVDEAADFARTSRAARRKAMRRFGIPRTQRPVSRTPTRAGDQYVYEIQTAKGPRRVALTNQTTDRVPGHGPHWEAGRVKEPVDGAHGYGRDPLGRVRVWNEDKIKVDYEK